MAEYRFKFGDPPGPHPQPGCYDTPPEPPACKPATCCETPCCCPAKVHKRDYLNIKPNVRETCLTFAEHGCSPAIVSAARECIELRIRKAGECTVLLVIRPLRATLEGAACFEWPLEWWQLRDNWYEADVFVNGCSCLTVGLKQTGCDVALLAAMHNADCCAPIKPCAAPIEEPPQVCNPIAPCADTACETGTC